MRLNAWLGVVALCGCVAGDDVGDGIDDGFARGKGDGAIADGSPEACAALGAANTASLADLDDGAALTTNAAKSIVAHRPFADLAALDAAPWIGPTALEHLVAYGQSLGLACAASPLAALRLRGAFVWETGDVFDEYSPSGIIGYTVALRAGALEHFGALGPGSKDNAVVDVYGPITKLAALTQAPHLAGPSAPDQGVVVTIPSDGVYLFTAHEEHGGRGFVSLGIGHERVASPSDPSKDAGDPMIGCTTDATCPALSTCGPNLSQRFVSGQPALVCTPSFPGPWQHGQCDEAGGTYRKVAVTADEACKMVDFLNHAPYSAMSRLGVFRDWGYAGGPTLDGGMVRQGQWHSLAQFARKNFEFLAVTGGAIKGLKAGAATWADDGAAVEDTVLSTFTNRSSLAGKVVSLARVEVTKLAADGPDGETCLEIHDTPAAPNFLFACACQNQTGCGKVPLTAGPPLADLVGHAALVRGTVHFTAGHWRIDAPTITQLAE